MGDGASMWGQGWSWAGWLGGPGRAPGPGGAGRRSEELLAERYAAGEIDDEDFRRRMSLLHEHSLTRGREAR